MQLWGTGIFRQTMAPAWRASMGAILLLAAFCSACGGDGHGVSRLQTIFGEAQFSAVLEGDAPGELVQAMGSLQVTLTDGESKRFATPVCSAFKIGPRHLITAKHCTVYTGLIFNRYHLVKEGGSFTLEFLVFGNTVRFVVKGDLDPRGEEVGSQEPLLDGPLYLGEKHDFAIYGIKAGATARTAGAIDLTKAGDAAAKPALFGYPNGAPLMRAPCHAVARLDDDGLYSHDCAAMGGSSGGLLGDEESGLALAIHLAGPANNSGVYYAANHRFESVQEFARERGCALEGATGELSPACVRQKGMNQALSLVTIREELKRLAPDLWREITE